MIPIRFPRKPSMRKAYGIYDETERLIAQFSSKDKTSTGTTSSSTSSASVPTSSASDPMIPIRFPLTRTAKKSDSLALGQIMEESSSGNNQSSSSTTNLSNTIS